MDTEARLINRTNEKISDKEIGNQELSAAVETLMIKKDILENLDKQILDGKEVEDVEQEMGNNDEYNSHLEVALRKIEDVILKSVANVLKPTLSASPANIPGSNSGTENTNQIQPTSTSTKFTKEVINFTKMGMIILNILPGVLYDLLKPDKPHLRPRSDCDITYLYQEHFKHKKHIPSNGWGGSWQKIKNTDIAIGDDIERIRLMRNELNHALSFKLGDLRFNELVSITNDILRRLNYHSKPTRLYTDELKEILAENISAEETTKAKNEIIDAVVPTEIKSMTDKQSVTLYLNLLESGSEKKRDIRLVVVGKKEAGKTSLLRRLFSEGIEDVPSTNGIEIHTITCKTKSNDGIWNKSDGSNEESKIQAGLLKQYREMIKASITTDLNGRMDESTEPETSSQQPEIRKHHVTTELQVNPSESTQRQDQLFEQTEKDLKKMLKSDVNFHDKEEYATLLFWDFAGDEEFYHTHQTFLSPDAIYLVVANLSEANDKEAQDLFCLWMDSIHCYCKMESDDIIRTQEYLDPPVVVVGTWKDAMTSQPGEILEVCKKSILTYTENITEDERRHVRGDDFVISNTKDDSSVFQSIRQEILKIARTLRTWNKDYPLKFIQLEKSLHEKKKVKPIIAFDELKQISTETPKPLNDEELILYLKYHHDIRALVYFEDLPDYIILDTLWLSNAFKCIVSAKKFRNVSIKNQKRWEEFHCRGKLHREVLEDIFQKEHKSLYKHKDHILNVMEKFDILIHPNISETHLPGLQTCYYVPCMIKEEPKSDIYEMFNVTTENCQKSIWLCFKFSFLPPHLKNHLTASLCRKYDIAEVGVLKQKKKQIAIFRSTVVFELQKNKTNKLLVMTRQNIIQIQVLEFGKEFKAGLYSYVADYVTDEINKIISLRSKMSNVMFEKKLECGLTEPEFVTGSNDFSEEKFAEYYCDTCKAAHTFNDEWSELQNITHEVYEKKAGQTGLVLIVNFMFSGEQKVRKGSEVDVQSLKTFFKEKLKYQVECTTKDVSKLELQDYFQEMSRKHLTENSKDYHSLICVIMSHGNENGIETKDEYISLEEIKKPFKNKHGGQFNGKPKVFLIQTCRGKGNQEKVEVSDLPSNDVQTGIPGEPSSSPEMFSTDESSFSKENVPTDADIIVAYATIPGYTSYRSEVNGTSFIRAFLSVAKNKYKDEHIEEILINVKRELSSNPKYVPQQLRSAGKCQMAIVHSTSRKKFFL